jgi:hypothetical protein
VRHTSAEERGVLLYTALIILYKCRCRIRAAKYTLSRPMIELGRYTMLKVGHKSAPKDPKRFVNTPVYGAQGRRNRGARGARPIFSKEFFPFFVELLPSVNFRNRLIVVNNRLISINRIDN